MKPLRNCARRAKAKASSPITAAWDSPWAATRWRCCRSSTFAGRHLGSVCRGGRSADDVSHQYADQKANCGHGVGGGRRPAGARGAGLIYFVIHSATPQNVVLKGNENSAQKNHVSIRTRTAKLRRKSMIGTTFIYYYLALSTVLVPRLFFRHRAFRRTPRAF